MDFEGDDDVKESSETRRRISMNVIVTSALTGRRYLQYFFIIIFSLSNTLCTNYDCRSVPNLTSGFKRCVKCIAGTFNKLPHCIRTFNYHFVCQKQSRTYTRNHRTIKAKRVSNAGTKLPGGAKSSSSRFHPKFYETSRLSKVIPFRFPFECFHFIIRTNCESPVYFGWLTVHWVHLKIGSIYKFISEHIREVLVIFSRDWYFYNETYYTWDWIFNAENNQVEVYLIETLQKHSILKSVSLQFI